MSVARAIVVIIIWAIIGFGNAQGQTYIVGVERIKYAPYYDHDNAQEYVGFAREVLQMFAELKGHTLVFKILPIKHLYYDFFREELDFKFPDNPYWQSARRKELAIYYSDPVVNFIDGIMVLPENKGKGVHKLSNIGLIGGFTPRSYLDLIEAGKIAVIENFHVKGLLKQVLNKHIDGAYVNISVAKYQLRNTLKQENSLVFDPDLPHMNGSYYLSSIKHPKVVAAFNKFLQSHAKQINALKRKHGLDINKGVDLNTK